METRRDVFQAIADPTRRAILLLLSFTSNDTKCHWLKNLIAAGKQFQSIFKFLTECELVKPEQKGREIYYHINPGQMKEIDKWIRAISKRFGKPDLINLDKVLLTLKKNKK
jgi:DNA-binding transcriptional ArsR family regulator